MENDSGIPPPPPPPVQKVKPTLIVQHKENLNKAKQIIIPYKQNPTSENKKLRIILLSDTHNKIDNIPIPHGDILIHAGDFTIHGKKDECKEFMAWIEKLPHKHKVVVCGNHEVHRMKLPKWFKRYAPSVLYLEDQKAEVSGLKFFGCQWRGKYERIEKNIDILVTHIPPAGYGDLIFTGESRGSSVLATCVKSAKPKFHIFGHNHEGYGVFKDENTIYVNAANCLGGTNSPSRRKALFIDFYPDLEIDLSGNLELKNVEVSLQ